LKASGEAGKEQIHQELSQAATRLDDFRRRLDETASIMNQGMAEALNAAQERARALADTELEGWQESLETGLAKTKGMLEAMEASFEQTKQEIADELTLTDERMDRIQQALEEASALIEHEMAQALENAADKAFVMADERFQTWQESAREEEAKTKALLEGLEASFGEAKQGLAQELADTEARMDTLKQRLDEAAALIEHEMAKAVGNAEAKGRSLADAALEQWKAAVEGEYAKTQGVLDGLEGSLAHTTAQAEAAMTGIGQQLEALQGRLQDAAAHIEQTMSQAVQQAEAKAAVLGDAHFEAWNQGVAEKEAAARQTLADTEAAFAEAQQRFQVLHQEIQEAAAHIEQTLSKATEQGEAAARATAEERLEQWRQAVAAQDLKTQGLLKALESASEDTKTKAADVYAAIETRLTELRASADETLDLLKTQVAETLRDTEQQILAEAKAHLDPWKAAIGEADSKAQDVLAALQGAAEETKVRLDTEGAAMEQRLTAFRAFADEAYLNLTTQIEQKLQTTEQQAGEHTDAAIKAWTETLMAEDLQVRTALSGLEASFAETKQQVETLQRQVGEAASKLEETMTQVLDTTEAKARLIADTGLSQWKSALETEQERATALLSRLEAVSTETKTQIAAEQAALEQQLQEAHRYTDEAVRTLQAEIAQTVKETEERAREEAQTQIAQWRQTIEEEETKTRTVFESMEGAFGDMQLKTAKEFTSAEERFKTLQDKIAEVSASMETELARTMEQAEAKARAATNQGMEQWKSAVETSKAEIQGLLAELAASSEEIDRKVQSERESLKGRLAELQTYTDDRLAQMKLQLQEVAETREQQVLEEADAKFEEYRRVQAEQFRRMETLADDSQALDAELRRYIQDLENRLREDFARFETQAVQDRDRIVQDFTAASQSLNTIMAGMESELAALKTRAYENVSEKLQVFEDAFATDLTQRNEAIDTQLTAWQQGLDTRLTQLGAEAETQRTALQAHFIETLRAFQAQVQQDMDGAYQKTQEVLEESDRRLGAIREAVEEVTTQTKLIDKAQELKQELEQRIEALKKDLDQLDKHWTEAADIEDEFVKIKRLEEDVHAKMTRFLSEKHRIEQIETDFNRLLLVSEAVEDKLSAISNSNDSLQELQIQIRKLTDALNDTEEKYQRLEKKNETLDITNDGIDRNFKALQESERMTQSITQDLHRLTEETEGVRSALHALNQENQQAQATADQLTVLDQSLSSIEERIEQMQKARKWLADIETRLEKLHKEAQEQVKLMGGLMKDGGKQAPQDKGAPPLGVRDNIIRLARLGWTVDEIARAVKCGKGEVELILEIMPKE
jgi:chromosome segregation ATPase